MHLNSSPFLWHSNLNDMKGWLCNGWIWKESTKDHAAKWLYLCETRKRRSWYLVQSDHQPKYNRWHQNKIKAYSKCNYEPERHQPQILDINHMKITEDIGYGQFYTKLIINKSYWKKIKEYNTKGFPFYKFKLWTLLFFRCIYWISVISPVSILIKYSPKSIPPNKVLALCSSPSTYSRIITSSVPW